MTSILEGELAETIADALLEAEIPLDVTITRTEESDLPPWEPGGGEPVITHFPCKGFTDTYSALERTGSLIQATDIKVVIIATTLDTTPLTSDSVTVRGETFAIITVSTDPARALWELQARR